MVDPILDEIAGEHSRQDHDRQAQRRREPAGLRVLRHHLDPDDQGLSGRPGREDRSSAPSRSRPCSRTSRRSSPSPRATRRSRAPRACGRAHEAPWVWSGCRRGRSVTYDPCLPPARRAPTSERTRGLVQQVYRRGDSGPAVAETGGRSSTITFTCERVPEPDYTACFIRQFQWLEMTVAATKITCLGGTLKSDLWLPQTIEEYNGRSGHYWSRGNGTGDMGTQPLLPNV